MADHFIRAEYSRLLNGDNPKDKFDSYSIILDSAIKLIYDRPKNGFGNAQTYDGHMLFQMSMVKGLAVKRVAEGVDYKSPLDQDLNLPDFLDPLSIWTIARAQLEGYCNFSNIYMMPKSEAERELLYLLWVIAGLKERQRGAAVAIFEETKEKAKREAKQIEGLIEEVRKNTFFSELSADVQKSIEQSIKDRKFQWYFDNGKLKHGAWHQLLKNAGVSEAFHDIYAMMSMWTHPSNVSVFQFREMYKYGFHVESTFFAMKCSQIIMSFFIRDYCEWQPEVRMAFDGLPQINQLMVNAHNRAFRGPVFALNDVENYV